MASVKRQHTEHEELSIDTKKLPQYNSVLFKRDLLDVVNPYDAFLSFKKQNEHDEETNNEYGIVLEYVKSSPKCEEIFKLLGKERSEPTFMQLKSAFQAIHIILMHLSDMSDLHTVCVGIADRFISVCSFKWVKLLESKKLLHVKAALNVMMAVIIQAPAVMSKAVKLLKFKSPAFREHLKTDQKVNSRVMMIEFILSYLVASHGTTINDLMRRADYAELLRNIITKLLEDPYSTVSLVLTTLKYKIIDNPYLARKHRKVFFDSNVLVGLYRLYYWQSNAPVKHTIQMAQLENSKMQRDVDSKAIEELTHICLMKVCCGAEQSIGIFDKFFATGQNANATLFALVNYVKAPEKTDFTSELFCSIYEKFPDLLFRWLSKKGSRFLPRVSYAWYRMYSFLILIYNKQSPVSMTLTLRERHPFNHLITMALHTLLPPREMMELLNKAIMSKTPLLQHTCLMFLLVLLKRVHNTVLACQKSYDLYTSEEMKEFASLLVVEVMKQVPKLPTIIACQKSIISEASELGKKSKVEDKMRSEIEMDMSPISNEVIPSKDPAVNEPDSKFGDEPMELDIQTNIAVNNDETDRQRLVINVAENETSVKKDIAEFTPHITRQVQTVLQVLILYQRLDPVTFSDSKVLNYSVLLETIQEMNVPPTDKEETPKSTLQFYLLQLLAENTRRISWLKKSEAGFSTLHLLLSMVSSCADNTKLHDVMIQLLHQMLLVTGSFGNHKLELELWLRHLNTATDKSLSTIHESTILLESGIQFILTYPINLGEQLSDVMARAERIRNNLEVDDDKFPVGTQQNSNSDNDSMDIVRNALSLSDADLVINNLKNNNKSGEVKRHKQTFSILCLNQLHMLHRDISKKNIAYIGRVICDLLDIQDDPLALCLAIHPYAQALNNRYINSILEAHLPKYYIVQAIPGRFLSSKTLPPDSSLLTHLRELFISRHIFDSAEVLNQRHICEGLMLVQHLLFLLTTARVHIENNQQYYTKIIPFACTFLTNILRQEAKQNTEKKLEKSEDNDQLAHEELENLLALKKSTTLMEMIHAVLSNSTVMNLFLAYEDETVLSSSDLHFIGINNVTTMLSTIVREMPASILMNETTQYHLQYYINYMEKHCLKDLNQKDGGSSTDEATLKLTLDMLLSFGRQMANSSLLGVYSKILTLDDLTFFTEGKLNTYGESLLSSIAILIEKSRNSDTHEILIRNDTVIKLLDLLQLSEVPDAELILSMLRSVLTLHHGFVTAFKEGGFIFCVMLTLSESYPHISILLDILEICICSSVTCRSWFKHWAEQHQLHTKPHEIHMLKQVVAQYIIKSAVSESDDPIHQSKLFASYWRTLSKQFNDLMQTEDEAENKDFSLLCKITALQRDTVKLSAMWSKFGKVLSESRQSFNIRFVQYFADLYLNNQKISSICGITTLYALLKCLMTAVRKAGKMESTDEDTLIALCCTVCKTINMTDDFAMITKLWNSLFKCLLSARFRSASVLRLLKTLISHIYSSERSSTDDIHVLYEMLWTHSAFIPTMMMYEKKYQPKLCLTELMLVMVRLDSQCCHSNHVPLILGAYTASMGETDCRLLELLYEYEKSQCVLLQYKPYLWGRAAVEHHNIKKVIGHTLLKNATFEQVINVINPETMLKTAVNFPIHHNLKPLYDDPFQYDSDFYDPTFLLTLFTHLLQPDNLVNCSMFARSNCLGLAIAALSSEVEDVRGIACCVLQLYSVHLNGTRIIKERNEIKTVLNLLKIALTEKNGKLSPFYANYFFDALRIIMRPAHASYKINNEILLMDCRVNLSTIPGFATMFLSSGSQFSVERKGMLRLLGEGLRTMCDYQLYHNCAVFKQLMAFYNSHLAITDAQILVLDVLLKGAKHAEIGFALLSQEELLSWLSNVLTQRSTSVTKAAMLTDIVCEVWQNQKHRLGESSFLNGRICCQMFQLMLCLNQMCCHLLNKSQLVKFIEALSSILCDQNSNDCFIKPEIRDEDIVLILKHWGDVNCDRTLLNQMKTFCKSASNSNVKEKNEVDHLFVHTEDEIANTGITSLMKLIILWTPNATRKVTTSDQRDGDCVYAIVLWMLHYVYANVRSSDIVHNVLNFISRTLTQLGAVTKSSTPSSTTGYSVCNLVFKLQSELVVESNDELLRLCNSIVEILYEYGTHVSKVKSSRKLCSELHANLLQELWLGSKEPNQF